MITGATQAEAAILIIDAKEGIREQTRRHANILSMLGLEQVIVVINKMDLVDCKKEIFENIKKESDIFLNSINIKPNYYIPIVALKGDNVVKKTGNMSWYQGLTVVEALDSFKEKKSLEQKQLILSVQDVYKIGEKRINVGRIEAGKIEKGQVIKLLPVGKTTKVKSIEKFQDNPQMAFAGENIGFTTEDSLFVERGNVVCEPNEELNLTDNFEAKIFWMGQEPLSEGDVVNLKCATQETIVKIEEIKKRIDSSTLEILEEDAKRIENLEIGEVILKTKKPISITKFNEIPELGRFVLMKNENICAGGIIV